MELSAIPKITKSEVEVFISSEVNKSMPFLWNVHALGSIEIQHMFTVRGGASFGKDDVFITGAFTRIGYQLPFGIPLSLNASYILNAYPSYKTTMHSVIPFLTSNLGRFELTLGYCFRFLQYAEDNLIKERMFAYRLLFHAVNSSQGNLSFYAGNFSDFVCENNASYQLGFMFDITMLSHISFTGGLKILQTGSAGLSSVFYGMVMNGGIRICLP
jgi:hypothetical protein